MTEEGKLGNYLVDKPETPGLGVLVEGSLRNEKSLMMTG